MIKSNGMQEGDIMNKSRVAVIRCVSYNDDEVLKSIKQGID